MGVSAATRMTGCFITSATLIRFRLRTREACRKPRFVRKPASGGRKQQAEVAELRLVCCQET